MRLRFAATAAFVMLVAGNAEAAILFKGVAVITARSSGAACVAEYDVGESFVVEYMANLAADSGPEEVMVLNANGAFLATSTDANTSLRGPGTVRLQGISFASYAQLNSTTSNFAISPNPIVANTTAVVMTGTINNLAIGACNVTFRASLTRLPHGGY